VPAVVARLRDVATVRRRSAEVLAAVRAGSSPHFRLDEDRAAEVADRIAGITRTRFPDLDVPYHSRWRHFEAGGVDRKAEVDRALPDHGRASGERPPRGAASRPGYRPAAPPCAAQPGSGKIGGLYGDHREMRELRLCSWCKQ
ncbi:MAG TPA: DUF1688 family protein, partial [Chloroflexia bacterium]|nr:DUF1688 family protein [Chloroflexia bacterium]